MSNTSWGNPTWNFIHTFVEKINVSDFHQHKQTIIDYIFKICSVLPCPECSGHAIDFLRTIRFENVSKKDDLIEIMFVFHNQVNKNLKKSEFPKNSLSKYSEQNIIGVLNTFKDAYTKKVAPQLMSQSHGRKTIINHLKKYIDNNKDAYS
jgi:hypothetical protein